MAYPEYYNVAPVEVQLSVVANLLLDPPDAYILQGDTVRYRLLQVCLFPPHNIKYSYQVP